MRDLADFSHTRTAMLSVESWQRIPNATAAALAALTLSACSAGKPPAAEPLRATPAPQATLPVKAAAEQTPPPPRPALTQKGLCSWYGDAFHGRRTANGEYFDREAMTAAHRTLPFDTKIRVRDLASGRSVDVRVNDRGPYVRERILDISRAAAIRLGILEKGVAEVELEVLDERLTSWPEQAFSVQIGAFKFPGRARTFIDGIGLDTAGDAAFYIKDPDLLSRFYRVRLGLFANKAAARAASAQLQSRGFDTLIVRESFIPGQEPAGSALAGTADHEEDLQLLSSQEK